MEYREIVAVTGLGGLYQLLATKSDGAVVRNVADKTVKFISARQHNVTPLESIEVYTTSDNVRLHNVFQMMQEHEANIPLADAKSADNNTIKAYFKSIFPEFDEERVYVSDMKKMLKWYEILKDNDLLHFAAEQEEEAGADAETAGADAEPAGADAEPAGADAENAGAEANTAEAETEAVATEEEKPKKAAKKKKAEDTTESAEEEKPAKKAAKKKKTEE